MSTYRVRVLPAGHGDCIVIEYGKESRILIDGGTPGTWRRLKKAIAALPAASRRFELLVVTHVDADHIGGALPLFDGSVKGLDFGDVWFNGYRHLSGLEEQGPVQGERLTMKLWLRMDRWNKEFAGKAVVVPDEGPLPSKTLPGGMRLTLLSPTRAKLLELLPKWEKECAKAGLDPQVEPPRPEEPPPGLEPMGAIDVAELASRPFEEDAAVANGSSIAFIAEYAGKSVLFAADAHPSVLASSIGRLPGGSVSVDAWKLPHHGSRNNVSPDLLGLVHTKRYLISTDGSHFKHPHPEAIARIVERRVAGCEIRFNYAKPTTVLWNTDALRTTWGFSTEYPADSEAGDVLPL